MLAIVGTKGVRRTPEEIESILLQRRTAWIPKPRRYPSGVLKIYAQHAVGPMKGGYME